MLKALEKDEELRTDERNGVDLNEQYAYQQYVSRIY